MEVNYSSYLMSELHKNYKDFLTILQQNEGYVLCTPPDEIVMEGCEIDNRFFNEHILEIKTDTDYRSLSGRVYKAFEHELHLIDESESNIKIFCSILSTEMYYADRVQFKRYMISNTIDPRFYKPI